MIIHLGFFLFFGGLVLVFAGCLSSKKANAISFIVIGGLCIGLALAIYFLIAVVLKGMRIE